MSHLEFKEKQRADPLYQRQGNSLRTSIVVAENRLELHDNILYRGRQDEETVFFQLVLPEERGRWF